jgi:hypothetical protein
MPMSSRPGKLVRYEIEEHLARLSLSWQEDSDDQAQSTEDMSPAATVYRRLRDAGWLEEERDTTRHAPWRSSNCRF